MQDRYAGDAGDFSKLGLLRALKPARAGVVWYRVEDESHNADGKHVVYLDRPDTYRACDPELFDALGPVARAGRRTIAHLADRCAPGWVSFDEAVPRGPARAGWHGRAVAAVAGCDLVCLDPDNGLAPPSVRRTARTAPKFAFDDEVAAFATPGTTVVVYQHLHRRGTAEEQARAFARRLTEATGREVHVVRYRRGSGRLYGVCAGDGAVCDCLDALVARWSPHFERAG